MFEKMKKYYDMGIYSEKHVADFVKKGRLTAAQYEEITGQPYDQA